MIYINLHLSWQRRTDGNAGGLILQYFLKGSSFGGGSGAQIASAIGKIRLCPHHCIHWCSFEVVFDGKLHLT